MDGKLSQEYTYAGNVKVMNALRYDWRYKYVKVTVF